MNDKMFKNLYLCLDDSAYDYAVNAFDDLRNNVEVVYPNDITILTKDTLETNNHENCYMLITTVKGILSFKVDQPKYMPEVKITFPKPILKVLSRLKLSKS